MMRREQDRQLTEEQRAEYNKSLYRIESTGKGNIDNIEQLLGAMGYELEVVPRCGR